MTIPPRTAGLVLLIFGGLELLLVALFGLLFPVAGALFWLTGLVPPGEDPMAIGITMIAAGIITAAIYAVPATTALVGAAGLRGGRSWGRTAGFVAAIANSWVLPPFGAAVCVVVILGALSRPPEEKVQVAPPR